MISPNPGPTFEIALAAPEIAVKKSRPVKDSINAIIKNINKLTILENNKEKIYGVQFHPEVTHTDNGKYIFINFLFSICKLRKNWSVVSQKKRLIKELKNTYQSFGYNNVQIQTTGRHDPCVGIRAVPVGEAMLACVLLDQYLINRGQIG